MKIFLFGLKTFFIKIKNEGKKNNVKNNEINIPVPAIIPNWPKPLNGVKAKLKKPIAIAIEVKNKALAILLLVDIKKNLNSLIENS